MKPIKQLLSVLVLLTLLTSCADSKEFVIDGKKETIEPYGWFDLEAKHDSINYKINTSNVVWSIVLCETVIIPILITGDQLFEPISKKQ